MRPWAWQIKALNGLVQQQGLADILDLGDGALEVKGLGKDNLEDLDER